MKVVTVPTNRPWKLFQRNMSLELMVVSFRSAALAVRSQFTAGAYSWVRRTLGINMEGEQTGK